MEQFKHEYYWNDIPTNKNQALSYAELTAMWRTNERRVRQILHNLSGFDNGDNYVLIRSGRGKGFYKTDNIDEILAYKKECLNKGRSHFAPVKKINRIINTNANQFEIENNMRLIREEKGLKQAEVCRQLQKYDVAIDKAMLSKMENGICLPTPYQTMLLSQIYECEAHEIINGDLYL